MSNNLRLSVVRVSLIISLSLLLTLPSAQSNPALCVDPPTTESLFPRYHARPQKNWLNDPSGPMVFNGVYHLFNQYNPQGGRWGNMSWSHMVSKDLVHWTEICPALIPDQPYEQYSDKNRAGGVYTGSITHLDDGGLVAVYTCADTENNQNQCVAYPTDIKDPFLENWKKSAANPVIKVFAQRHVVDNNFRDPTSAWKVGDKYYFGVAGSVENAIIKWWKTASLLLYSTSDFQNFTRLSDPLFSTTSIGDMFECPDFFPITDLDQPSESSVFVVKVSKIGRQNDPRKEIYLLGSYDTERHVFIQYDKSILTGENSASLPRVNRTLNASVPLNLNTSYLSDNPSWKLLDFGPSPVYASKRFYDAANRRQVLFGWINEDTSNDDTIPTWWAGTNTLPRQLGFDKDRMIVTQSPLPELEQLRQLDSEVDLSLLPGVGAKEKQIISESPGAWNSAQFEIDVTFNLSDCVRKPNRIRRSSALGSLSPRLPTVTSYATCTVGLFVLSNDTDAQSGQGVSIYVATNSTKFGRDTPWLILDRSNSGPKELYGETNVQKAAISVRPNESLGSVRLRVFVDHSVVEVFLEDRVVMTTRAYPNTCATRWGVFGGAENPAPIPTTLKAWKLNDAMTYDCHQLPSNVATATKK